MIHFKPNAFFRSRAVQPAPVLSQPAERQYGRADHARMLAHAAKRRMAAQGLDGDYWKACAPAAIAKAAAIRTERSFARLP